MLNVLLVDDEFLVRLGIKSLIDWDKHQFHYVGDAQDGLEALDIIEKNHVDIILTDIVMPRMNGIELIEKVKSAYPDTHMIVLSSHNDYEYVRKAMKLGVDDYILKASLTPDELLQMLLEVSEKINQKRSHSQNAPQQSKPTRQLETQAPVILDHSIMLLVKIATGLERSSSDQTDTFKLLNLIEIQLKRRANGTVHPVSADEIAVLLHVDKELKQAQEEAYAFGKELIAASKRFIDIPVHIGVSEGISSMDEWDSAYTQAKESLLHSMMEGKDKVYRDDIQQLMSFIHEHYTEDISLKRAAEMVRMSENYVSYLFKKETGVGLTEYLNQVRVTKAAELLLETRLPVYLIAEQVGYENFNYFGRIFKKIKGDSPQQYRLKYQH